MKTTDRRDRLTGEGAKWYDRAVWLRGRTLDVPSPERTLFQTHLDSVWNAVACYERGEEKTLDLDRLEAAFSALFERWPDVLGPEIPSDLR